MPLIQSKSAAVRRSDISENMRALTIYQQENLVKGVDWWKDGVTIYWTAEAAVAFNSARGNDLPEPEEQPDAVIYELKAVKLARNSFFVACQSPHEEGCCVHVKLLKKGSGQKFLRKTIKVQQTGDTYQQIR